MMGVITVSREFGSGGDLVAKKLAEMLNYTNIDKVILSELAAKYGLLKPEFTKIDERRPSFLDRFFKERQLTYLDLIQSVIYDAALKGDVVIVGRGAQVILQDLNNALHVKIISTREKRIARVMEEEAVSREIAEELIAKSDRDRSGYIKYLFDSDWNNLALYDIIINTAKIGIDMAVNVIAEAARSPEFRQLSRDSLEKLEKLALVKKVRASLIGDQRVSARYITVGCAQKGVITLKGRVSSEEEKAAALEVARGVEGVVEVVDELTVMIITPVESFY